MKRFAYYIACCTLVALCACTHDDTNDVIPAGNGKIMIQASLDDMAITRAFDGETAKERTVTHIDVFAVDPEGNIDYYERNTAGNNNGTNEDGSGVLTLNVARRAKIGDAPVFAEGVAYKFYLVANSRTPVEAIKDSNGLKDGFKTEDDLKKWIFDDIIEIKENVIQTNLHLTGTTLGETNDTDVDNTNRQPQTFLMDAVAKFGNDESVVVNPATGGESSLTLSAVFKRAAAKILVNIKQGPDVVFHKNLSVVLKDKDSETTKEVDQTAKYYFYKLPASTFVLPNDQQLVSPYLITTAPMDAPQVVNPNEPGNEQVFRWSEDISNNGDAVDVQVLGYAYAHEWSDVDLTNETSLILNIPMYYKENDTTNPNRGENGMAPAPNSWYKVPLSKDKIFERNTCYVVNITINAVGATNKSDAIMLRNIEYETLPWQEVGIEVGNEDNRPAYLELNTDLVEIYNANFDNTSLSFSSSSAITSVTLKDVYKQNADGTFTSDTDNHDAYYINKFGIMTSLSETIKAMISATAQPDVLNGNIAILSPIVNTTEAEREKALAALGDEPKEPAEVAVPSGMPEPELPDDSTKSETKEEYVNEKERDVTTTTTISYHYEGVGENIKFYKTTTVTKTYKSKGKTHIVSGYPMTTTEEYVDDTIKQEYISAYNEWVKTNDDAVAAYNEYLIAKKKYDVYHAAYEAINNSGSAGDTHYNTIRYLEFEVENEQGLTATFRVMQYPVIYITNQLCWFSYRDDFGGTTYLDRGANRYVCATFNNGWGYSTDDGADNHFFASKVADDYNEDTGACTLYYYRWYNNGGVYKDGTSGNTNAHYYHIHVTANSPHYTIGIPRTDANGYTISSADNEQLVSPSFMIASQLGAVWSGKTGYDRDDAAYHCSQYVEVYRLPAYEEGAKTTTINGQTVYYKELRDWRLPTAAEIQIIVDHQTGVAMDVVLGGGRYYSAGTSQYTSTGQDDDDTTIYTRCIRDEY
ncbi:MAG: hypothetical protein IJ378_06255 [Alistipes sp.]|nr:hypothetical protein [Alistipes sp.]